MDLYSGLPYWIAKNPLYDYFNPLVSDHITEVAIIGGGITGALVAHELCSAGIQCTVIDKRGIGTGSSTASTALLQYEIDTPLSELVTMIDEPLAVRAYHSCLQSIDDLEKVFTTIGYNPGFKRVPSVFYASNRKGLNLIKNEYDIRKKYNLPAEYLDKDELYARYQIKQPGAIVNNASAQMDAYAGSTHLIDYHRTNNDMKVFTHTDIINYYPKSRGYELETKDGHKIHCNYVVIAAGFESGRFLPKDVMKLTSTYAIISEPLDDKYMWKDHSLIWETKEPYIYIRTTENNRILVGGEDENFKDPVLRDKLLRKKVSTLENKFNKLFPDIPFVTDMAWCGTFSTTKDGLPFIGNWPGIERMLYALGYGGNGITFSMIAAQMIKNRLMEIPDEREEVYGFDRMGQNLV